MDTFKEIAKVFLNIFYAFCSALFGIYLGVSALEVLGYEHSIYLYICVCLGGMYTAVGAVQGFMHEPFAEEVEDTTAWPPRSPKKCYEDSGTNETSEPDDMEDIRDRGHTRPSRPFHY